MEKRRDRFFQIGLGLTITTFLFDLIAFVSPSWLESIPEFRDKFIRLGLWVACFNNYIHPEDYVSKAYSGCWYVYYPEYYYIRPWLNPGWFYAVQMLSLVAFILRCVCLLIVSLMACKAVARDSNGKPMKFVFGSHAFCTCTSIIVLIIMGVKSRDREWMPRPDQNRLSWGYGMAVIAGFASIFGAFIFGLILMRNYIKEVHDQVLRSGYSQKPRLPEYQMQPTAHRTEPHTSSQGPPSMSYPRMAQQQHIPQGQLYTPQGQPYAPQGQLYTPQGQPYTPQGQPYTPQGQPYTPQGQPYTPQGQPYTPQGQPYTPQGQQHPSTVGRSYPSYQRPPAGSRSMPLDKQSQGGGSDTVV